MSFLKSFILLEMNIEEINNPLIQNQLTLKIVPISIRELLFITKCPCDVYGIKDGLFFRCLRKGVFTNKNLLRDLIAKDQTNLFCKREDSSLIMDNVKNNLLIVTRSLSVGNSLEKCKQLINLITINMGYLYSEPNNDSHLKLQHQCAKNLAYFLMNNINYLEPLQKDLVKQKHHFIYAQPMIASLFLIGLLKYSKLYSDKEIEDLFIASYFKDIGMSTIPTEKYNSENLTDHEKVLLNKHPESSVQILKGRIPLSPSSLKIIKNHHAFSLLREDYSIEPQNNNSDEEMIVGFETVLVISMDIISAMITGRPFKKPTKLFDALDLIKKIIADQYPQEFKLIVGYFKQFFFDKPKR